MFNIVDRFMKGLTIDNVRNFAISKNIYLSEEELNFTYNFIKKNYQEFMNNPKLFDIDRYKDKYSEENFIKIKKVFTEYFSKYQSYL